MSEPAPDVPYDQAAAAAQALRDLGHAPGQNPVVQLEHLVTLLFARSTELLAQVAEAKAEAGRFDVAALEQLERVYEQCLTGLAPLAAAAVEAAASPVAPGPVAADGGGGRPGGWGCDWHGQAATAPVPLWRMT